MPPQVNARLVGVTDATAATQGRDDWDAPGVEPAGAGAQKWTAADTELNAYLQEKVRRQPAAGGGIDVITTRTLYIDSALARLIGIDTDDVLTFVNHAGTQEQARAVAVSISELDGIPPDLQTARLELEPRSGPR